jgi:hypothetical protein
MGSNGSAKFHAYGGGYAADVVLDLRRKQSRLLLAWRRVGVPPTRYLTVW